MHHTFDRVIQPTNTELTKPMALDPTARQTRSACSVHFIHSTASLVRSNTNVLRRSLLAASLNTAIIRALSVIKTNALALSLKYNARLSQGTNGLR
jgi:hypothetical protein